MIVNSSETRVKEDTEKWTRKSTKHERYADNEMNMRVKSKCESNRVKITMKSRAE